MNCTPSFIFALLLTTLTINASDPLVKIIAHRGASAHAPENTLAAFRLALNMEADGVELDVHISADSRLMVIHDPHTGRTGDKHLNIAETHSEELRKLDVGRWKGEAWEGESIPFLEEALPLIPLDKHLFIECKFRDSQAFLKALDVLWEEHEQRLNTSTFISFHAPVLLALREARPHLTTLLLVEDKHTLETYTHLLLNTDNPLFSGIGIDKSLPIDELWIESVKEQAQILSVWTVNVPQTANSYYTWGFHYITTDAPDLIRSTLLNEGPESADKDSEPPKHL